MTAALGLMGARSYGDLPSVELGVPKDGGDTVTWNAEYRYNGCVITGRPGVGKSWTSAKIGLQDLSAQDESGEPLAGVLYVDSHPEGVQTVLDRIPPWRRGDVRILSTVADGIPRFPLFENLDADEHSGVRPMAELLASAWRVGYGRESFQARADDNLVYALRLASGPSMSPLEVQGVLSNQAFRAKMRKREGLAQEGRDFDVWLWLERAYRLHEDRFQLLTESVQNKLNPLLSDPWMRLATCGLPPLRTSDVVGVQVLEASDLLSVMMLGDGVVVVTRDSAREENGVPVPKFITKTEDVRRLTEPYLVSRISTLEAGADGTEPVAGRVMCEASRSGMDVDDVRRFRSDVEEPGLLPAGRSESQYVRRYVARRRLRRAWERYCQLVIEPRGVRVEEALSVADLLDDRRVVLVEIPEASGEGRSNSVANFVLIQALMRTYRQLALPRERVVPTSLICDEAAVYMSDTLSRLQAQCRKARASVTISLQRMGQLDEVGGRELRRAVMDTVGTRIHQGPAGGEVGDVASETGLAPEKVKALSRGEAVLTTLRDEAGRKNVLSEPVVVVVQAPSPQPAGCDGGAEMRRASVARLYQPRDEAETHYLRRVNEFLAGLATEDRPRRPRSGAERSQTPSAEPEGAEDES